MKQLFAATLLVAALGITGCGEAKKPAPKTTPAPAAGAEKPADNKPAETPKAP
jgi:hypothetical protein